VLLDDSMNNAVSGPERSFVSLGGSCSSFDVRILFTQATHLLFCTSAHTVDGVTAWCLGYVPFWLCPFWLMGRIYQEWEWQTHASLFFLGKKVKHSLSWSL
jgi:hypothetical protein